MGKIVQMEIVKLEKRIANEEVKLQRATNLGQTNKRHFYLGSIYTKRELLKILKKNEA